VPQVAWLFYYAHVQPFASTTLVQPGVRAALVEALGRVVLTYTVIARRWRPKKFRDVVGQPHIVTTIQNSLKYGRVPHAYLFTGPRGVGKTSLARIIAKAVNCLRGPSEEPCDACENCLAIHNGGFVDVVEIDAASTRKIDDIRELRETVKYLPMKGRYKVYILDEAHMLTGDAKDAFLKTLEEPPGHNIFILATTEAQKIPYTIMSRCQRFDFRRISEKEMVEQLRKICKDEKIACEESVFPYIAAEADGSLRDAESLLDQIIAFSGTSITEKDAVSVIGLVEQDLMYRLIGSIVEQDLKAGMAVIDDILARGYDVYQVYRGLVAILRNMLVVRIYDGTPPGLFLGDEELQRLMGLAKDFEYYEIQNLLHFALKGEELLGGLFPKVALEVLFINLYNLSKIREVETMVERLAEDRHDQGNAAPAPDRHKPGDAAPAPEITREAARPQETFSKDVDGFIRHLKQGKSFIAGILESVELKREGNDLRVSFRKGQSYLKDDRDMREGLKEEAERFFGPETQIVFQEVQEEGARKRDVIREFVEEAEKIFRV
jgi:DNA polymerase III subunit gamma/tau